MTKRDEYLIQLRNEMDDAWERMLARGVDRADAYKRLFDAISEAFRK